MGLQNLGSWFDSTCPCQRKKSCIHVRLFSLLNPKDDELYIYVPHPIVAGVVRIDSVQIISNECRTKPVWSTSVSEWGAKVLDHSTSCFGVFFNYCRYCVFRGYFGTHTIILVVDQFCLNYPMSQRLDELLRKGF